MLPLRTFSSSATAKYKDEVAERLADVDGPEDPPAMGSAASPAQVNVAVAVGLPAPASASVSVAAAPPLPAAAAVTPAP